MESRKCGINDIEIDVYVWNKVGLASWKSCGFRERCLRMRWNREEGMDWL
jgi:hypothetical protein